MIVKLKVIRSKLNIYIQSPEKIAFSLALLFGILSAVLVPQMSVNDEGAHFLKSYSLTTGKISGKDCTFPTAITDKTQSEPANSLGVDLTDSTDYSNTTNTTCGSASNYSPIMHLPQAIGIAIGKLFNGSVDILVLLGRLANVIFYAVALYWIVRFAKLGKWVYVVIGLFPIMIHTAGSLSGDVMNNVIVMISFAFIFNFFTQKNRISRKQIIMLAIIGGLLAVTKASNIVLLLPLVALPVRLFKENPLPKLPFNLHKWLTLALCFFAAVCLVVVSQKIFGSALFMIEPVDNPLATDPLRFFYILYNTYINPALGYGDLLIRGIVGEFSSFKYHLPTALVFIEFILLIFTLMYTHSKKALLDQKTVSLLAFWSTVTIGIFIVVISFALYSAWAIQPNRLGTGAIYADGVQGRYFTAALLLLVPIGLWLGKRFVLEPKSDSFVGKTVLAITLLCLSFYTLQTILVFT